MWLGLFAVISDGMTSKSTLLPGLKGEARKMNIRKSTSKPDDGGGPPNKARRSFVWRAGAGLSALFVAAVPGVAGAVKNKDKGLRARVDKLSGEIGVLKDENSVRLLYQRYEDLLDRGLYEEVAGLFNNDSEVIFNGGLFKGKGVDRLYRDHFSSGLTGKRIEYNPNVLPDIGEHQDIIEVAPDRKSAGAWFTYSIQVGAPVMSDSVLIKMARLHGEGILKWWEGGTCEISFIKSSGGGRWEIKRVEYKTLARASYRPGRSYTRPISAPRFIKVYPEDPSGPDQLV